MQIANEKNHVRHKNVKIQLVILKMLKLKKERIKTTDVKYEKWVLVIAKKAKRWWKQNGG